MIPLLAAFTYMLQGGAIFLMILASVTLFTHRASLAARYGSAFMISAACAVASNAVGLDGPAVLRVVLDAISILATPLFWLMARAWFDDGFRLSRASLAALAAYVLICGYAVFGSGWPLARLADWGTYLAGAGLAGQALWLAWKDRDVDLVEPRRRARFQFVMAVGAVMIWALLASPLLLNLNAPHAIVRLIDAGIVAVVSLATTIGMVGLRRRDAFPIPPTVKAEPVAPVDPALLQALNAIMAHERLYRSPDLTIGLLAGKLQTQEYRVRALINAGLGYRNFNDYINTQRLAEVRHALEDQTQAEVSILTIAMDAGFGSLAAFNRAFKASAGVTPSDYRRRAAGSAGAQASNAGR
jgi:AraC-like DNA-binding protein